MTSKSTQMSNYKHVHYQNYPKLTESQERVKLARRERDAVEPPSRPMYESFNCKCPICMKLQNKSKKFETPYRLLYHLNNHNSDDELTTKITLNEIKEIVKQICIAIKWRMLFV